MTIQDIYHQYSIPINLQQHMLRVAAVASIISDHLTDIKLDNQLLVTTMLLHDMGNILKFDLTKPNLFSSKDQNRIDEIKTIQNQFQQKYGSDCDLATLSIMKELRVGERAIALCRDSHGTDLSKFLHTNQWDKKISFYSDMRVGPFGIISIKDRFDDFLVRYPHETEDTEKTRLLTLELEHQLQHHCSLDLSTINDSMVSPIVHTLKHHQLKPAT